MSRDGQDEVCRVHAAMCLQLAQKTDDPESKIVLPDMARSWLALSRQNCKKCRCIFFGDAT
jgi:hypothetical protein